MKKKSIFIAILIFWLLLIFGLILFKQYTLWTGQEILLKTVPVDPRDFFRGDYVILSYEISRIDKSKETLKSFKEGETVYVSLNINENKLASFKAISQKKPTNKTFLKGRITRINYNRLFIEYGIESYFVPEGKGYQIENQIEDLQVKIAVDKSGNAVIKGLYVNGNEVSLE
jgi:uncharacterized membrane-anchored protein